MYLLGRQLERGGRRARGEGAQRALRLDPVEGRRLAELSRLGRANDGRQQPRHAAAVRSALFERQRADRRYQRRAERVRLAHAEDWHALRVAHLSDRGAAEESGYVCVCLCVCVLLCVSFLPLREGLFRPARLQK